MEFHQLGGFGAGIYCYGTAKNGLSQQVFDPLQTFQARPDGSLELVLGIKRSGTSHLLLTREENDLLKKCIPRNRGMQWRDRPYFSDDFESLSPIVFTDFRELKKKLDELTPKSGTGKQGTDTSSLNKAYSSAGQIDVVRSQFENSRVLYRTLQNDINPRKFALDSTSWTSSIRVFSFCCNVWSVDSRPLEERKRAPRMLDVGLCEAPTPTLAGEMITSSHIVLANNSNLQNAKKLDYEYDDPHGPTETLDAPALAGRVRDFFSRYTETTANPIVLLVHHRETAMNVLKSFGVDISRWEFELKKLLRPERIAPPRQAPSDPRRRSGVPRGRSASPRPHDRSRRESPPRRAYAPVYVVDVHSMYTAVMKTPPKTENAPTETVLAIYKRFRLLNDQLRDKDGWCAGNECWMLVEIFCAMATRRAIDDQHLEWPAPPSAAQDEGESDVSDYGDSGASD
ncbi:hypothetical protein B0H15DRAFT_820388 [Mycena belliarum]|uniref:Uncharacterized protein n=1 Tax=Mycena belliarum TaxID=1033014 RepID=A0AAD6XVS0_9AGAR|nr:hypothetical protein B0H15DRAFT_820388 [Mycena belliae]